MNDDDRGAMSEERASAIESYSRRQREREEQEWKEKKARLQKRCDRLNLKGGAKFSWHDFDT
jgi:hypothetical protein